MLGMVVIFVGTGFIPAQGITLPVALVLLLFVVAAGAVVGAAHGLVLIWLLHMRRLIGLRETGCGTVTALLGKCR
jgi:hypothetical protein